MKYVIWFRVGGAPWVMSGTMQDRKSAEKKLAALQKEHPDRVYEIREAADSDQPTSE